jgi:hypothetical protein
MKPLLFVLGCIAAAAAVLLAGCVAIAGCVATIYHLLRFFGVQ